MDQGTLADFGRVLSTHIRKEERQLFEGLQQHMSGEQLDALGAALDLALRDIPEGCILPKQATRLRPRS